MKIFPSILLAMALITPAVQAKLNVVATLPDFGSVAEEVGGDRIKVTNLARGGEDPHFVDARPSLIVVLNKADLLIYGGAELEMGWLPPLANNARNSKILPGASGNLNAAVGVRLLDIPVGPVDRSQGDVHPSGNPHYMLDPLNAKIVATSIAEKLATLDPANGEFYKANARRFGERIDQKLIEWTKKLAPLRSTKVVTYHKSFDHFLERFGLVLAGTIEPKPGIEPSPTHINALIPRMKQEGVKLMLIEHNRPKKTPNYVAHATGAKLVLAPQMVGGDEAASDYVGLIDHLVKLVSEAMK